jgi:hypothetical protein
MMARLGHSSGTHAVQSVGKLAARFMHVRQALEAFSQHRIHPMPLRSLHSISKQRQRGFVAPFCQMNAGSQGEP